MNKFQLIDERYGLEPLPSANAPIFVVATVWRSGSTLVQRTISSDHSILLWGEPFADCNLITSLSRSALALTQKGWPREVSFATELPQVFERPEDFFIANLYPEVQFLRAGHRALLDNTFRLSAQSKGRDRFGCKFVRLGFEEASYLQWIYPDAKFVFLVRNPWDCWRSYKGCNWMYRWPKQNITKVDQFAKIWNMQTQGLLQFSGTRHRWLRYEDFLSEEFDWDDFREFCELSSISKRALEKRIKGIEQQSFEVTDQDILKINRLCGILANQLGYNGLKQTDVSFSWS